MVLPKAVRGGKFYIDTGSILQDYSDSLTAVKCGKGRRKGRAQGVHLCVRAQGYV